MGKYIEMISGYRQTVILSRLIMDESASLVKEYLSNANTQVLVVVSDKEGVIGSFKNSLTKKMSDRINDVYYFTYGDNIELNLNAPINEIKRIHPESDVVVVKVGIERDAKSLEFVKAASKISETVIYVVRRLATSDTIYPGREFLPKENIIAKEDNRAVKSAKKLIKL